MNASLLHAKLKATSIHLLATALIAALAIVFVNHFWFPFNTLKFLKGYDLFFLLIACDVALGPLLSLIIYNPQKSRKEKILDYSVIGAIQLAALCYGLHAISENRLLFLVFSADRFEAVSAGELSQNDLQKASNPEWRNPGYLHHYVVAVKKPDPSSQDYVELVMSGLDGRDLQYFTERYEPFNMAQTEFKSHIKPISASVNPERLLQAIPKSIAPENLAWLPLSHDRNFATLLVDKSTGAPITAVDVDPYAAH